jgi:hypothetical protein
MIFFMDGTIEKPVPENLGLDTIIIPLSDRWAKLDGECKFAPPPLFALQKGSAVRGLICNNLIHQVITLVQ